MLRELTRLEPHQKTTSARSPAEITARAGSVESKDEVASNELHARESLEPAYWAMI